MATTIKIPQLPVGTDGKFRVTVTKEDFDLERDAFNIVVKNQYGRVTHRILKEDCYQDSEGKRYFNVENVQEGKHCAIFIGAIADTDYGKVRMQMTGEEFLKLIEGREPNSEINTIHEMMDAMHGISDDKTIIEEIDEQQEENEASDDDIDSIFD